MIDIEKLKNIQNRLKAYLNLTDIYDIEKIRYVAGIDLTYTNPFKTPTMGIACLVVWDVEKEKVTDVFYENRKVNFPYIPTFLAFRELPLALAVAKKAQGIDAFILDGMGIIHPRRMGIATHFGIKTNSIAIGCAKSYLIGEYKKPDNFKGSYSGVYVDGELAGYALRSRKNAKEIFISPGNNISVESSLKLVLKLLDGYRIPPPTRFAHNYLKEYRKRFL